MYINYTCTCNMCGCTSKYLQIDLQGTCTLCIEGHTKHEEIPRTKLNVS